jgi:peptidoglycan/LPS O-acetylase OafA/YrhL
VSERHDNNFTFLRFVAASMVIVAHAHDLLNIPSLKDPLFQLTGRTMGWVGVSVFFTMSGYLIMNSLDRSSDLVRFARARALRIFPGLAVCILLSVLLLGLFVTTRSAAAFFTDHQTFKYILGNISLISIQYGLPGVFEHNPMPGPVNGSLWTLPYETLCYIFAGLASGLGLLRGERRRALVFAIVFLLIAAFLALQSHLGHIGMFRRLAVMTRLDACFLMGMAYAAYQRRFTLRWWHVPLLAGVAWLTASTVFYDITYSAALSALALWLAFVPSQILRRLSKLPDYSYGIYIYAFPIQQVLMMKAPGLSPMLHALIAFPLILIPAGLSWHFIEKPALRFKNPKRRAPPAQALPAGE